jgi:hypothetical protein
MLNHMRTHCPPFRLLACVLVIVLAISLAAPARAEADVLTIIAIASLAVAGIILIAYLIIANVDESRRAETPRVVWVACAACAMPAADPASPAVVFPEARQER